MDLAHRPLFAKPKLEKAFPMYIAKDSHTEYVKNSYKSIKKTS